MNSSTAIETDRMTAATAKYASNVNGKNGLPFDEGVGCNVGTGFEVGSEEVDGEEGAEEKESNGVGSDVGLGVGVGEAVGVGLGLADRDGKSVVSFQYIRF